MSHWQLRHTNCVNTVHTANTVRSVYTENITRGFFLCIAKGKYFQYNNFTESWGGKYLLQVVSSSGPFLSHRPHHLQSVFTSHVGSDKLLLKPFTFLLFGGRGGMGEVNKPQTWHSVPSANTPTLNTLDLLTSVALLGEIPWEQCSTRVPANIPLLETPPLVFVSPVSLLFNLVPVSSALPSASPPPPPSLL